MGYEITYDGGFSISPPVENIEEWELEYYDEWVISEDGKYVEQGEYIGGCNGHTESLQELCDRLKEKGYKVEGVASWTTEEGPGGGCGVTEIEDNKVSEYDFGELGSLLRKIYFLW